MIDQERNTQGNRVPHGQNSWITRFSGLLILALLSNEVFAGGNYFQDGVNFSNAAVAPGGQLSTQFSNAANAETQLNSGTNIVQPNSSSVLTMQNNGVLGNANGTGLGSFGTSKINSCASYVQGTGGPTQDAECGAVNFASQQTNINAKASAAYGLTPNSSLFANANAAVANAKTPAGMTAVLPPGTSTSLTGTQTCTTNSGTTQYATQSCFIYANQTTSGGAVTTYSTGSQVNVTCTNPANITSTSCTVSPPQKTYSASCQQSVNVAKTCNNIASANVTTGTANHCTSGTVTIYTSVGAEWWGMNPNYGIPNPIGSAVISCAADNSSATVTLTASGWINSPTVYNLSANTPSSGTASIYYGISVPWSWSGGTLSGGGANGSGAGGFIVKVNLGTSSATIVTPTNSNGCSSLANM